MFGSLIRAAAKAMGAVRDPQAAVRADMPDGQASTAGERASPSPPQPVKVQENVTVVLRRQVPPRAEPARSWIGGLPTLPTEIEWPRAHNAEYPEATAGIPLNFLAQIACADLPTGLWGGLGPREGWLIFFASSWGCNGFLDKGSFRAFHVPLLGEVRQPPDDKRSVGDPMYSGGDNRALQYERWPVDLVVMPDAPMPDDVASILYDGAPVGDCYWRPREAPFTWGMIADMTARALQDLPCATPPGPVKRLPADARDHLLAKLAQKEVKFDTAARAESEPDRRASFERAVTEVRAQRDFLLAAGEPFCPETLATRIEASQAACHDWHMRQSAVIAALRAEATLHDPMAVIAPADQTRLTALFDEAQSVWRMGSIHAEERLDCPVPGVMSLGRLMDQHRSAAVATGLRTLYRAGPAERESLPDALHQTVEADLRRLEDNRPHRMGGRHQAVQQTDAPPGKLLLLQLGNDEATGFSWGDSGALFAWIDTQALQRGDFDDIEWWTENT